MRILNYPTYEYNTYYEMDSSYILSKALKDYLVKKGEFVYWFTPIPKDEGDILVDKYTSRDKYEIHQYQGIEKFYALDCEYPIDFAVTNNPGKGIELINYFDLGGVGLVDIPVYIWDFSNKFEGPECEQKNIQKSNLIMHAVASCLCKKIVYCSNAMLQESRRNIKKFLSPSLLERFDRNSKIIPFAFDCEELKKYVMPKDEKLSFYFGGRFTSTKRGEQIARYYDYIFSLGHDVKVKLTVPFVQKRLSNYTKKRGQEFEIYSRLPQTEAWKIMSTCHISIHEQQMNNLGISPLEQLYAGLVVLFRFHKHEKDILPPNYPFIYNNESECFAMLKWIIENYEEAKKRVAYVPEWLEKNVDRRITMDYFYNDMLEYVEKRQYLNNSQGKRVKMCFDDVDEIGWKDLIEKIKKFSRIPNMAFAQPSKFSGIIKTRMHQQMIPEEFYDDCKSLYPNYVRRKK